MSQDTRLSRKCHSRISFQTNIAPITINEHIDVFQKIKKTIKINGPVPCRP
jgi:hypothetical protein